MQIRADVRTERLEENSNTYLIVSGVAWGGGHSKAEQGEARGVDSSNGKRVRLIAVGRLSRDIADNWGLSEMSVAVDSIRIIVSLHDVPNSHEPRQHCATVNVSLNQRRWKECLYLAVATESDRMTELVPSSSIRPSRLLVDQAIPVQKVHVHPACSTLCQRRQTRNIAVPFFTLRLEKHLHKILFLIFIIPRPKLVITSVDFAGRQFEGNGIVRLGGNDHILKILIRLFNLLLVCTHESNVWLDILRNLGELDLEQQAGLRRDGIANLLNPVSGSADLDKLPLGSRHTSRKQRIFLVPSFFCLKGGAASEMCLVLPPLGVGEVGAVVLMYGEAEPAFKLADVILEEVGVFGEIDGFEGKFAKALAAVGVGCGGRGDASAAEFGARAVLESLRIST